MKQYQFDPFADGGLSPRIGKDIMVVSSGRRQTATAAATYVPPAYSSVDFGSSLPGAPVNGQTYFLTTNTTLYVYYNAWIAIGSGSAPPTDTHTMIATDPMFGITYA